MMLRPRHQRTQREIAVIPFSKTELAEGADRQLPETLSQAILVTSRDDGEEVLLGCAIVCACFVLAFVVIGALSRRDARNADG